MNEELDILFRKYFSDQLTEKEKLSVDERLVLDPAFKEEFDDYELGILAGNRLLYKEVRGQVMKAKSKAGEQSKNKLRIILPWIAATAAAVAFLLYTTINLSVEDDPGALYASYYERPSISSLRSADGVDEVVNSIIKEYQQMNYTEVILRINDLDSVNMAAPRIRRILAHSYLNVGEDQKAQEILRNTSNEGSDAEKVLDRWYLGLSFMRSIETDSMRVYLGSVANKGDFLYSDAAAKILKRIE